VESAIWHTVSFAVEEVVTDNVLLFHPQIHTVVNKLASPSMMTNIGACMHTLDHGNYIRPLCKLYYNRSIKLICRVR